MIVQNAKNATKTLTLWTERPILIATKCGEGVIELRDYLIKLRNEKRLSQQDVARKLGISRQYYQMIETGERQKHLDLSLAGGLAALFDVSVMDIEHFEEARRIQQPRDTAE